MGLVQSPKDCLVCLNSRDTMFVPTEESEKIFNICCSYVKDAINIEFLTNNIIANNSKLSFCKNCFQSSLNISQLVEQLSNLKKEIHDLAGCFSENIAKQRIQAFNSTMSPLSSFENDNTKINVIKNQSTNSCKLHVIQRGSEERNSFMHSDTTNKLPAKEIDIDEIGCEIMKIEKDDIFLDCEDKSCNDNVIGCNGAEFDGNYLLTGHENEIDPLGEIELEHTPKIVNNCSMLYESKARRSESHSEFVSFVSMPNIVSKRIQNEVLSNSSITSTKTCYQDKPEVNFHKIITSLNGPNCYSTTGITNPKQKTDEIRKEKYKHKCSICEKRFITPIKLKRHYFIHTGERPYKCTVCEKAFKELHHLKSHERLHTGEKPYKCRWCKLAFKYSNSLKDHERIHIRETPYK